jgi:ribosomal-protein-alanine N-acetyltransferase
MPKQESIYISELKTEDALGLFELMDSNKQHFGTFLPVTASENTSLQATKNYIQKKEKEFKLKSCLTYAIKLRSNHKIAGLIILKNIDLNKKQAEFAYGIGQVFEGRGFTTQAVQQLLAQALGKKNLETLVIITHKDNIGSCIVAENCGFRWVKTLENEFTPPDGSPMHMELYELRNQNAKHLLKTWSP